MPKGTKFFNLQSKEKIIKQIKPLPVLKWFFFFGYIFSVLIFMVIIFVFAFFFLPFFLGILVLALIIAFALSHNRYKHQNYWITNKRVIYKRGLVGYTISSIPLERISDVIVSRTFLERIFGFGSLYIQSLAGQSTFHRRGAWGSYLGAEGALIAIPDPEKIQELIFKLVKMKRKREKLTF